MCCVSQIYVILITLAIIIVLPIENQDKLIDVMTVGTPSFEVFLLCSFFLTYEERKGGLIEISWAY